MNLISMADFSELGDTLDFAAVGLLFAATPGALSLEEAFFSLAGAEGVSVGLGCALLPLFASLLTGLGVTVGELATFFDAVGVGFGLFCCAAVQVILKERLGLGVGVGVGAASSISVATQAETTTRIVCFVSNIETILDLLKNRAITISRGNNA